MLLQEKMVEYRARHNMSQKVFAEKCNVSLQTINSVEQGLQKPSRVTEAKILMVLKEDEEESK